MFIERLVRRAATKNETVDRDTVLSRVDVGAEDLDPVGGQGAGQISKQTMTVACANGQLGREVSLLSPVASEGFAV